MPITPNGKNRSKDCTTTTTNKSDNNSTPKRGESRCSSSAATTTTTSRHRDAARQPQRRRARSAVLHSDKENRHTRSANRDGSNTAVKSKAGNGKLLSPRRRSCSRDRIGPTKEKEKPKQRDESVKRKKSQQAAPPKRTKSNPKRNSSQGRRESDGIRQAKKKAPIRRTRSYENITTTPKTARRNLLATSGNQSMRALMMVDERGLPLTSVGCPPVASLRTCNSPNNVDTDNFDAMLAHKLQEEECSRARRDRRTSSALGSSRSLSASRVSPEEEDDRKPAAKRRSKSSKRPSRRGSSNVNHHQVVPLNPEESIQYHKRNFSAEAKSFVQRLSEMLDDMARSHQSLSSPNGPIVSQVLTDHELRELVSAMFLTQKTFEEQGKPHTIDIGYHFCRGNNMKRIQQQPGLWSKLQAKGANKSQDGDGVYTFNNPPAGQSSTREQQDVWMVVARLQGSQCRVNSTRRQWSSDDIDSFVRSENDVVVLRASTQFFPLLQFNCAWLTETSPGHHLDGVMAFLHLIQERLQTLLHHFFNEEGGASPPDCKDIGKQPGLEITKRALSFNEQLDAVRNPAAWEIASEVQAVVQEHAGVAAAMLTGFGKPSFAVHSAVSAEEMVVLADSMLLTQKRFAELKKPAHIEIGYHYCRGHNLKKMQQKRGFWSNIQSRGFNKSEDGDGIYTFNDPLGSRGRGNREGFFDMRHSFSKDDDVWLLVARLQGNRQTASSTRATTTTGRKWDANADALILGGRQADDVVVLRTSAQFFPVLQFSASSMETMSGDEPLQQLQTVHQKLQDIFDHFFNNGTLTSALTSGGSEVLPRKEANEEIIDYHAPKALDASKSIHSPNHQIYKILSSNKKASNDDCSICLDSLRRTNLQVARLKVCGHDFHRTCLHEALQHFNLCPICNQDVTPPPPQFCLQGLSPSGRMMVTPVSSIFCQGCWAPAGSLVISFAVHPGLQKEYHPSPGARHQGSKWKAFLPNNEQGLRLLRRLQHAFLHGLLFAVKQSESSDGVVVRASIPLKTRHSTEVVADDAFPDLSYFDRCHQEMDRFGVPEFDGCQQYVVGHLAASSNEVAGSPARKRTVLSVRESAECARVLKGLQKHQHGWMFCKALPAVEGKVQRPMDFTMIEGKLGRREYSNLEDYIHDVNLTFDNAMACHSKENPVHYMAKQLKRKFRKDLRQLQMGS